ncbi:hypothetical protein GCM10027084_15010 [Pseudoxanthomonas sangjuensis]
MCAAKAPDLLLRNKTLGRSACNRNSLIVLIARTRCRRPAERCAGTVRVTPFPFNEGSGGACRRRQGRRQAQPTPPRPREAAAFAHCAFTSNVACSFASELPPTNTVNVPGSTTRCNFAS